MRINDIIHKKLNLPYSMNVSARGPLLPNVTIVFLHGLGASNKMWDKTIEGISNGARVVSVDMLGFGKSVKPTWIDYSLDNQVKSLHWTLAKKGLFLPNHPIIFVGHSLGALVAMKFAIKYPNLAHQLVLISPPIYKDMDKQQSVYQKLLFKIYKAIGDDGNLIDNTLTLANGQFTWEYDGKQESLSAFQKSLSKGIMMDPLFDQALRLKTPTVIYFGMFDPLVVDNNLKEIDKINSRVKVIEKIGVHTPDSMNIDLTTILNQLISSVVR